MPFTVLAARSDNQWSARQGRENRIDLLNLRLGNGIATMELNNLISELVLRFDTRLADPYHDWTVYTDGLVRPQDFRLVERKVVG